jgi:hypothetical protein
MKKYVAAAERFPGAVMMQIYGDESPETRKLMVTMKVKVRRGAPRRGARRGAGEGVCSRERKR